MWSNRPTDRRRLLMKSITVPIQLSIYNYKEIKFIISSCAVLPFFTQRKFGSNDVLDIEMLSSSVLFQVHEQHNVPGVRYTDNLSHCSRHGRTAQRSLCSRLLSLTHNLLPWKNSTALIMCSLKLSM